MNYLPLQIFCVYFLVDIIVFWLFIEFIYFYLKRQIILHQASEIYLRVRPMTNIFGWFLNELFELVLAHNGVMGIFY